MTSQRVPSLAVLSLAALLLTLLAGQSAAQASTGQPSTGQPSEVPACFASVNELNQIMFELPALSAEDLTVRHNDGRELNPFDYAELFTIPRSGNIANRPRDWRPVTRSGGNETVHPRCTEATRLHPTAPQPTLQWLPGATIAGPGARGPARVSWQPVTDNGVAPSHYEVHKVRSRVNNYEFPRSTFETEGVVVDGSVTRLDIDLGSVDIFTTFEAADVAVVRAWWPDGVSEPVKIDPPEQITFNDDAPGNPELIDVRWVSGNLRYGWGTVELSWTPNRAQSPDRYQIISHSNGDGPAPRAWEVTEEFPAGTTSAVIDWRRNQGGGTTYLRSVWDDNGPLGGPTKADTRITGVIDNSVYPQISRINPTNARIATTTEDCVYGNYRVTEAATGNLVGAFDAPNPGQCYFDHGITLGVDTTPLEPSTEYNVTFVAIDIATTRPYVNSVQTASFFTSAQTASTTLFVEYTPEEAALLQQAAARQGTTDDELQRLSALLFAYLAAVEDKPAVNLEPPSIAFPNGRVLFRPEFTTAEIGHIDGLGDHFGGLGRVATVKISTLVLAYVILTS